MSNLKKLADVIGIQNSIPGTDGKDLAISDETRRLLLRSMGLQADDEDQAAATLLQLEDSSWLRPLAPALVTQAVNGQILVPITLQQGTESVHWTLTTEQGKEHSGDVSFKDLELVGQRTTDGRSFERRNLPLTCQMVDGYHDLRLEGSSGACRVIVTPGKCWLPSVEEDTGRLWGVAAQVYLLKSEQNWGIGDYSDLRRLVTLARQEGAGIVGVNPLHAMFLDRPGDASPYSPSDRLLLNVLNIDINEMPELAHSYEARALIASEDFQIRLQECRDALLVDYEKVAALKMPILRLLFQTFNTESNPEWNEGLSRFRAELGSVLDRSCLFQALRLFVAETDSTFAETQKWPKQYSDLKASGVEDFARNEADSIRFQLWLQWTADRQLGKVQEASEGMAIGLYRDLAVGSHASGAEAWSRPELFAREVQIGAPPDPLNPAGQNWGLPPLDPRAMQIDTYSSFIDLLRANMRHAGALRIDHVMAIRRLYWIPTSGKTKDGAYVFYPIEDLVGIIALESQRNKCLVIGEDLGGVPDGFQERMTEANILSYRVLSFERDDKAFHAPRTYPYLALSVAGNHDLPTLSGWWSGEDIDLREKLDLFPAADGAQQAREMRVRDRHALLKALQQEGLIEDPSNITPSAFSVAAHEFLARTRSLLTIVQLDDLAEEPVQVNVPGTSDQNPNWRRKLSLSLEQLETLEPLRKLSTIMQPVSSTR